MGKKARRQETAKRLLADILRNHTDQTEAILRDIDLRGIVVTMAKEVKSTPEPSPTVTFHGLTSDISVVSGGSGGGGGRDIRNLSPGRGHGDGCQRELIHAHGRYCAKDCPTCYPVV